ncbi:MAG: glutamate-cysteine ligase family protein [Gemmatimonadota bacterium]|nr:glutamate-cysteine ligase family protein [Gemmatimonadota bacterium]
MPTVALPTPYTLGIEEEYQLVEPESGALLSRARAVISGGWTGEIKQTMQENTVEIGTRVCADATEAAGEVARLRLQTAAAGTHPFSHLSGQRFTDDPVYQGIRAEYRRIAESQNIFGMHVHVGVPPGADAARLMNAVRLYLPHLLALAA